MYHVTSNIVLVMTAINSNVTHVHAIYWGHMHSESEGEGEGERERERERERWGREGERTCPDS